MKPIKPISRDTIAEIRSTFHGHFNVLQSRGYGDACDGACEGCVHEWTRILLSYAAQMQTVEDVLRGVVEECTRILVNATIDALPQTETEGLDKASRQSLNRYLRQCIRRWEYDYRLERKVVANTAKGLYRKQNSSFGPPINE